MPVIVGAAVVAAAGDVDALGEGGIAGSDASGDGAEFVTAVARGQRWGHRADVASSSGSTVAWNPALTVREPG